MINFSTLQTNAGFAAEKAGIRPGLLLGPCYRVVRVKSSSCKLGRLLSGDNELAFKISYDFGGVGAWFGSKYSLDLAGAVEKAGFDVLWMGDHFMPWFHDHAHTQQAWVWLAAAAQATKRIPVGPAVTIPMFKYHPLNIAHAFVTIENTFPRRVILGVGTGEAMNEAIFVPAWPPWKVRGEMLCEAIELIKKYWSSPDYFDFDGKYWKMKGIYAYDKPTKTIPIYFSAFGPKSAALAGKYGDHLMTYGSPEYVKKSVLPYFEEAARNAGKDPTKIDKSVYLDGGYGNLKKLVSKYRVTSAGSLLPENFNERDPRKIQASAVRVSDDLIREKACLFSSPRQFVELIEDFREAGLTHFIFGDWGYNPAMTIRMFGSKVIPHFRRKRK